MAKKTLKMALSLHQNRLKKNAKVKEAAKAHDAKAAPAKINGKLSASTSKPSPSLLSRQTLYRPPTIPFSPTDKILLIGEGNFSFSLALFLHPTLTYLPPSNVTATVYDTEDSCNEKYPESAEKNIKALREKGVEVLFGVDAMKLESCKVLRGRQWDRVVWNFPHAGSFSLS